MSPKPKLVGITGGIGSGKSTVAKIFEILGIPVYYADDKAKSLMNHDSELKEQIIQEFGEESYNSEGDLNRKYLASTVFSDPEKVKKINSLVHPAVGRDFETWASIQSTSYVLKEAALIFETGGEKKLDAVINVSSPLKIRVNRVLMRDPHRSLEQINQIIDQQIPDEDKNERADFVIKNTENKMLIPQVLEIHQKLQS
ncbi:MAG TPA: dephospho-CoA kinase [Algoriphagus sp.]|jgi:dephospho-CoA kinase|uniref:dephospho-CoA kinase n=1 Tax=unclassified Algoriphagus TaxID=2641541 RepID=UPI000C3739AB|nr:MULTISPECIES: dephospho-CoA kinase [unclassified Algoriphagus]MAL12350.1 dephospho-CoA kinase [Algoriphagus sp.]MAN88633.1 dephospho-CoA kinase [Algoriphagus sp.]QYH40203.1 dephospho-CoA kinase [Algoriphagus sp. NBT04N3]HAH36398.1 dephospho-CoA kinase [Algoriphagus sp.]HAS59330.1 dephospho-CoA kinase [Algoriphagus sp.]|tara:strand:+ start:652 stop:1248 length:597 start_codon:yes stop_codon:yes gene_type:complete